MAGMSTPRSSGAHTDPPTPKQLKALRSLAASRGKSFVYPRSKAAASREIRRLMKSRASTRAERQIEADNATRVPRDSTAVRDDEITGYGSNCTWSRLMQDR
jgi:hypothetical protein